MGETPLRREFGWTILRAEQLAAEERFAEAYDVLQYFADDHAAEDTDGWLLNAVRLQQGSVLRSSGDLEGALGHLRKVEAEPGNHFFYVLTARCTAQVLDELDRPEEALACLRESLDKVEGPVELTDLEAVLLYAELADRLDQELPGPFLATSRRVLEMRGAALSDCELGSREQVLRALRAADEKAREREELPLD